MANNVTPNIVYLFNYETQETSAKPIVYTHLYTRSQAVARIAAGRTASLADCRNYSDCCWI